MRCFSTFACIDWSGAQGARQKGIALAICGSDAEAPRLIDYPGGWSRDAILNWLLYQAQNQADLIVGIDFSPALPFADHGTYFPEWPDSPDNAAALWRFVDTICQDDPYLTVTSLIDHPEGLRHFRRHRLRTGDLFEGSHGRLRVVERLCRDLKLAPAQSGFNLIGAAQVGKSSLTGMRMLHRIDGRVPIWPFDPVPNKGPLIVEIYTTIAARAAGVTGGSKMRSAAKLDEALARLGCRPHDPLTRYDDHSTDAILTAAWLRKMAHDAALWSPAVLNPNLIRTEGWTFGVP